MEKHLEEIKNTCHDILEAGGVEAGHRDFFRGKNYRMLDINPHSGADIIGDAHQIPLHDQSLDAVIAENLMEHLHSPHLFVEECKRLLRPGGKVLISVPFIHPYHGGMNLGTHCPDYYRFTKDGLAFLFRDFDHEIGSDGGFLTALSYFRGFNLLAPVLRRLPSPGHSVHQLILFGSRGKRDS